MMPKTPSATVTCRLERWPYTYPFRITGRDWIEADLVYVEIERDGVRGRGECAGIYYKNDPAEHCIAEIERVREAIEAGAGRSDLLNLLPAGGARNAIDCALWELEAKEQQQPVWKLAGLLAPRPVTTTYTIGADEPKLMAERARAFSAARALKLKLTGTTFDADCVRAVRQARPDVWLAVDANQGFTRERFAALLPTLQEADVKLIEQPFPLDRNADMDSLKSPIPVAADESAQTTEDLSDLAERFDIVNIKLDKCGGLTAGLAMAARAREMGLGLMIGNMSGTSLAMAPAFLIGQLCDVTDLDGPLLLREDRTPAVQYSQGRIWCGEDVWGYATAEVSA
ncbi:MAG TPA: dipeptide epimerase [Candidatus Baltobacteraceae bacterium]|jgi:L-alanine-DL-glutamate epimerase-like enolase superfamily enzyme|nr:dipeptide epimerase [Candidatus Baltobacteraceae bacterium]